MRELLQNEHFWVYLALFLFIIIFGKLIYTHIKEFLNQQISLIKENIDNTKKPLEESIKILKKQKSELILLNEKIQNFKQKDKESSHMLVESFYENLNIKLQYIDEIFKNYLKNEDIKHFHNLANILINDCYCITTKLLKEHLTALQKQQILNASILKLDQIIINKH